MSKRLTKTQRAMMLKIISAYNRDELRSLDDVREAIEELGFRPEMFIDWPLYSAGENMPGYMPDSPYYLFLTDRAARGYCRELEREAGGEDYVSDYMSVTLRSLF